MAVERSLYEVLQVDPRAEPEVLEAAFRRLARKYHPDVSASLDGDRRMKELNAAYEVLRDGARRAAYDRELLAVAGRRAGVAEPEAAPEPAAAQVPWSRLVLPALWFFIVLGVMAYLVANSASLMTRGAP